MQHLHTLGGGPAFHRIAATPEPENAIRDSWRRFGRWRLGGWQGGHGCAVRVPDSIWQRVRGGSEVRTLRGKRGPTGSNAIATGPQEYRASREIAPVLLRGYTGGLQGNGRLPLQAVSRDQVRRYGAAPVAHRWVAAGLYDLDKLAERIVKYGGG
jgi:hypothetical protein